MGRHKKDNPLVVRHLRVNLNVWNKCKQKFPRKLDNMIRDYLKSLLNE
jgi:hypothetical protein